jgi:hypothetical protein
VTESTATTEIHALPIERMGAELLKALVDEVRLAPAQWAKLTQVQQDMLIERLRSCVRTETEKAVRLIAAGSYDAARCKIESLTVKDGAKCVLQVGGSAHDVLDYVGQQAVLVMCDHEQYFHEIDDVEGDKDQPELPLEPPAAAKPLTADDVEVGTEVRFLSAAPDGLVRKVRAVHRSNVGPPTIEVTGLPDTFEIALFELVTSDQVGEGEAEAADEAA